MDHVAFLRLHREESAIADRALDLHRLETAVRAARAHRRDTRTHLGVLDARRTGGVEQGDHEVILVVRWRPAMHRSLGMRWIVAAYDCRRDDAVVNADAIHDLVLAVIVSPG